MQVFADINRLQLPHMGPRERNVFDLYVCCVKSVLEVIECNAELSGGWVSQFPLKLFPFNFNYDLGLILFIAKFISTYLQFCNNILLVLDYSQHFPLFL